MSPCASGLSDIAHQRHRPVERAAFEHTQLHRREILCLVNDDVAVCPYFIFGSLPFLAWYLSEFFAQCVVWRRLLGAMAVIHVLAAGSLAASGFQQTLGRTFSHSLYPGRFPEKAVEFIEKNSPDGKIFNHFNWGGYLIWELYPRYKVFIDGRSLNLRALSHYTYMLWDPSTATKLLNGYGIRTVIIPPGNPFTGEAYELVKILDFDKQWHLVFRDQFSLVYVRGGENDGLMKRRKPG